MTDRSGLIQRLHAILVDADADGGLSEQADPWDYRLVEAIREAADALEQEALPAPTLQRIYEAHSYLDPGWPNRSPSLGEKHAHYKQSFDEACYICTLLKLIDAQCSKLEQYARDAARYRWLHDKCKDVDIRAGFAWLGDSWSDDPDVSIDKEIAKSAAIDAAMSAKAKP